MINPMDLSGKRVLVTGASSGIGRGTAILLSQLGARVTINGRDPERLEATSRMLEGEGHTAAVFDLDQLEAIPAWIKKMAKEGGAYSGFVHSSGLNGVIPLRIATAPKLEEMMRVNVFSAMMALKGFRQKGCCVSEGSSAVLLSSVAASIGLGALSGYSATKGAIEAVVRSLAIELAHEKIRVNAVAPGWVATEMLDKWKQFLSPEQYEGIFRSHPLGISTVDDVANAIAFLLCDGSRTITGTTLTVDGGYTAQ